MFRKFAFVILLSAAAAVAQAQETSLKVTERGPGIHQEESKMGDGTKVRYTVSVPKGYMASQKSQKKLPLILALHYGGEVKPFYGRGLIEGLVEPGLGELKGIIVAPDSLGYGWQGGKDEKFVISLLDAVQASYAVDKNRVVVTGFSMGGIGTWYFAYKYPNRFSVAVPVAGKPVGDSLKIPVFAVNSEADKVIPIGPARAAVKALKKKGHNAEIVVIKDLEHYSVPDYATHLQAAVKWIRKAWKKES